ncbi:MAG: hypothetical protein JW730_06755 [Anaerolineales bacterium]|nr:hypothetical protein [Anaerolineales bacterium]
MKESSRDENLPVLQSFSRIQVFSQHISLKKICYNHKNNPLSAYSGHSITTLDMATTPVDLLQRRYRFRLILFILLFSLPILLYYGYCWGWWGRQSLLLQYLFQCSCPIASEEARYPDEVDVIVSACGYTNIRLSPGGRLLYVNENKLWLTSSYLLDLQTNEKVAVDLPKDPFYFLTDNLAYVSSSEGYILDWVNKKQYPIQKFAALYPDAYMNGEVNLDRLAEELQEAKHVFLIHDNDAVIALAAEFPDSSEYNFITGRFDIPGLDTDRVQAFLQKEGIVYQSIPESFPAEVISPDERFIARADGIYFAETGQRILEGYSASRFYRPYSRKYFMVRGWTHDGTGIIYSKFLDPCLIETNFFVFDDYGCFFEVPQPVILLKVPEEDLLPAQRP